MNLDNKGFFKAMKSKEKIQLSRVKIIFKERKSKKLIITKKLINN